MFVQTTWDSQGSKNKMAKLNEEKVLAIRSLSKKGAKQNALATMFGVSPRTISSIISMNSWVDMTDFER